MSQWEDMADKECLVEKVKEIFKEDEAETFEKREESAENLVKLMNELIDLVIAVTKSYSN